MQKFHLTLHTFGSALGESCAKEVFSREGRVCPAKPPTAPLPHTSDFRCLFTFLHHSRPRCSALTSYICLRHILSAPSHLSRIISPNSVVLLCEEPFSRNEYDKESGVGDNSECGFLSLYIRDHFFFFQPFFVI